MYQRVCVNRKRSESVRGWAGWRTLDVYNKRCCQYSEIDTLIANSWLSKFNSIKVSENVYTLHCKVKHFLLSTNCIQNNLLVNIVWLTLLSTNYYV